MSNTLRGRLLAAICTAAVVAAAAAPVRAETLADALSLAYQSNPSLLTQRATQRALDESYVQARSQYRPQLSFQSTAFFDDIRIPGVARQEGVDTNGDGIPDVFLPAKGSGIQRTNSGSVGLSLDQPIWTGGRVAAATNAAQADILSGRETLRRLENQVMLQTIQAYLDVRRDQEALRIRQLNVEALRAQLDESRARLEAGDVTRTDVAQAEARFAQAQASYSTAVAQLAISRSNYALVVGQNPGELAAEPSLAFMLPANADEAFSVAEQFSPLLRQQEYAEQASRARVAQARANRMPQVSLRGQYLFGGPVAPLNTDRYSREVIGEAVVSVPIFTGGLTSSQVRQAVERNNADRITIETQRRTVLQQITQGWNQLVAARANIDSTQQSVRAAEVAAEGTREELKLGLRTTIDVLNAEQELRNDELSVTSARHDEYLAGASVLANMGRLEAKNLIPAVTPYDPARNFRKLRFAPGYVPWEEPIAIVDQAVALPAIPQAKELPLEKAIGPGLPPPSAAPASPAASPKK